MENENKVFNKQSHDNKKKQSIRIMIGRVIEIRKDCVVVRLKNNQNGICQRQEISDHKIESIERILKFDYVYKFKITGYDGVNNQYTLSYKAIHPKQIKNKSKPVPTASHNRNLWKKLLYLIENYELK